MGIGAQSSLTRPPLRLTIEREQPPTGLRPPMRVRLLRLMRLGGRALETAMMPIASVGGAVPRKLEAGGR